MIEAEWWGHLICFRPAAVGTQGKYELVPVTLLNVPTSSHIC